VHVNRPGEVVKLPRARARQDGTSSSTASETSEGGTAVKLGGLAISKRYISETGKTSRAFRVYIDLTDTADWFREKMNRQLWTWELTMPLFRVLETLYNQGPQCQHELSRKFRCSKQNVASVLERLEDNGWIQRKSASQPRTSEGKLGESHREEGEGGGSLT
jgi:hypothetical protein